ncbi:(2Fe-2S)-binding protein [Verminephrobacter sp. Larva24]|nr:(2Fe-2S)-binding protein [Verminephrobacter sp. Larva24]
MYRPMFDTGKGPAAASGARLAFTFDGRPLTGRAGDTVAAALLANGVTACRATPVSGAPRAPYCMMGICFECLVVIDGIGNRQGCLEPLRAGMRIATQHGRRQTGQVRG